MQSPKLYIHVTANILCDGFCNLQVYWMANKLCLYPKCQIKLLLLNNYKFRCAKLYLTPLNITEKI